MFGRVSITTSTSTVSVIYLGLLLFWQSDAATHHRSLLPDAATTKRSTPIGAATSGRSLSNVATKSLRSLPTDVPVTVITNTMTTSVGGLQACLKAKTTSTTRNVRFQTVRVPAAGGGASREFSRRSTHEDFMLFHSNSSEISASDFGSCARIASTKGLNAFSFEGTTCTGYNMTKYPVACSTGNLVVYIDLGFHLASTSYYENDVHMFFTVNPPLFEFGTNTGGNDNVSACEASLEQMSADFLLIDPRLLHAAFYNNGKCSASMLYIMFAYYDVAGGHVDGAATTVIVPKIMFKRLKSQYFDDLCGTTLGSPPIAILLGGIISPYGEEDGPLVIYSHKGYGFNEMTDTSATCRVTFSVPGNSTNLVVTVSTIYLDGGAYGVCEAGDRVKLETSTENKLLCNVDPRGNRAVGQLISKTEDVNVTLTQDPHYSDRKSTGFNLYYYSEN